MQAQNQGIVGGKSTCSEGDATTRAAGAFLRKRAKKNR